MLARSATQFSRAAELFGRARPWLPGRLGRWELVGLNERFRYYRYDVAERFAPHLDGAFTREGEQSQLTFMLYLNDGFAGGETNFFNAMGQRRLSVRPEVAKCDSESAIGDTRSHAQCCRCRLRRMHSTGQARSTCPRATA